MPEGIRWENGMIHLKDIISIKELIPHESVAGQTRVIPWPHDILEIEGQIYRINYMNKINDSYEFTAIRTNLK